jgi:hypothetical protein
MTRAELHSISRVLSDPRRFEILQSIAAKDCAACSELRSKFPITAQGVRNLCGLVETARRGNSSM